MNETKKFLPDDPQLTAFALGELEGAERAAVEAALRDDPAAQAVVAEIRATAAALEAALGAEPLPEVGGVERVHAAGPATGAAGRREATMRREGAGQLLRFPQLYFVIGSAAAACFALAVIFVQPTQRNATPAESAKAERLGVEKRAAERAAKDQVARAQIAAALARSEADRSSMVQMELPLAVPSVAMPQSEEAEPQVAAVASAPVTGLLAQVDGERAVRVAAVAPLQLGRGLPKAVTLSAGAGASERSHRTYGSARAERADTEAYAFRAENDFLSAQEQPLSTFGADVDTASYANVRRFLRDGRRPPVDAVRIEELVNYFPYAYAAPTGDAPFAASLEVAEAPWAPTHRLVRIGLKGREVAAAQRGAANLVFLLDVSGSMNAPNKLPLVKESLRLLLGRLRSDDRVAIVTYAGASGLALPSTPVAKAREIVEALDELRPGGSTNGALGLHLAYDIAKANFVAGGVNRVVLCTDGDFNVGVTSEGELVRLIREKAQSGVFLTALGFGMGNYKDAMLQQIADAGNGNYGYIDTRREAEKLLVAQVSGTLVTIAKDVKLQVEFNPAKVARYRLIGYEKRLLKKEDFNHDAVDAGEIGAGHTVTALYEIVPAGTDEAAGAAVPAVDELRYRSPASAGAARRSAGAASGELLTVKVRYKEPDGAVSRKLEFPLTDAGARWTEASEDFRFATAVAAFGLVLRESPHKGTATLASVATWAEQGSGSDPGGDRAELVGLVRAAEAVQ